MAKTKKRTASSDASSSKKMRDTGKKTIVIKRCTNEAEADITIGRLAAAGIKASISKDDVGGMYPSLQATGGGVSIRVRPQDIDKATQIIRSAKRVTRRAGTHLQSAPAKSMPSSILWPLFLLGSIVILVLGLQVQLTLIYIGALLGMTGIALEIFARRGKKKVSKQLKPHITAAKKTILLLAWQSV